MRKTKNRITRISPKCRTTSLILALTLILSAASVGFATLASAVTDDSLAETGAGSRVKVADGTGDNYKADSDKAFWVDATYFDYYSDEEDSGAKWLEPKQAGTGFNDAEDDWYTFEDFNRKISSTASSNKIKYPLYFGNFCNTVAQKGSGSGAYIDSAYQFKVQNDGSDRTTVIEKTHGGPYARVVDGLYNYRYFINNSNGLNDMHDSVINLAQNKLDSSGNILTPTDTGSTVMPYFNESWLTSQSAAKVFDSSFPFRQATGGDVTTYSFNSTGAKDNVFFNWNEKTPISVAYGQGEDSASIARFGVKDGLSRFMGDQSSTYGIFPFNRANDGNGGNNNLDYGFGIKMDMDFRVPENGKIGSDDVKFNYSGDDDIWVYITPYKANGSLDYANSYLALDLGGNHKMAQGEINFSTMKSTITTEAAFADSSVNYKGDTMYVAKSDGWNDVNIWAWDDNGNNGHWVTKTKMGFDESGHDLYAFKLSDFNSCYHFTVTENANWDNPGQRSKNEGKNLNCVIHSQLGNVCWSDNPNWIIPKYPTDGQYTDLAGVNYATAAQKTKTLNGGAQLDPDQTYHMTIFYMERGMIESNCQMSFTMTPVKNDFKVNKTVNVTDVNAGLKSVFTQDKAFGFTTTEGSSLSTGKKYTIGGTSYTVGNDGKYSLKHNQTADFANQHETGSTLLVCETAPSDGLTYTTTWNVVDNNNSANVLKSGDGTATQSFELVDPRNASARANLQANFVNTPTVAPLSVTKYVVDEVGNAMSVTDEFTFTIKLNLGAGETAYDLAYTTNTGSSGTATGGVFKLKTGETATFAGIPIGATYTVTETPADGYKAIKYSLNHGADQAISGTASISSTIGANNTLTVTNQPGEASASFELEKEILSGETELPYQEGTLFSFKAQGKGPVTYEQGKTSLDASSMSAEIDEINGGKGTDDSLSFSHAGVYIFEISELQTVNNGGDDNDTKTHNADFIDNNQKFLAKVTVTANGSELTADNIDYYKYDGGAINASSFSADKKIAHVVFTNTVKTGKVTVNKKDGKGSPLSGVQFSLYKKTGATETLVKAVNSGADGKVVFDDLDIYEHGASYSGTPAYQTYVLKETSAKNGYMKENTVYEFKFPTYDSNAGELKYEYTFDYVNAALKQPDSGSVAESMLPLGIALIFLSFVSVGLYIAQLKKKQLAAQHVNRFIVK